MRKGYAVTVSKYGEDILTIEHECLSGKELSDDESRAVWEAGEHLMSFVGDPDADHRCFICGSTDECGFQSAECPLKGE